jgi:hypothetical protein
VKTLQLKEKVQNWILAAKNDSISKILSENSNLTKTQLETLLIDVLVENIFDTEINYEKKAGLRVLSVTRGAFNRTLRQARTNIIKSIYTILLLGYLGMFDDCSLYPYLEISNKLQKFMNTYKNDQKGQREKTKIQSFKILHKELESVLETLSQPRAMSSRL